MYASAHMANKYSILLNNMSMMIFINCHREIIDFNANKNVPKLVTTVATQISVLICFCGMKRFSDVWLFAPVTDFYHW